MTVRTDQIRSVRKSEEVTIVEITEQLGEHIAGNKMLVAIGQFEASEPLTAGPNRVMAASPLMRLARQF